MPGLREKKKARTQEDILRCASRLLSSKGYAETTMEEIAECAEVGVGTIYNYFGSKKSLLVSLMSSMTDELVDAGDKVVAEGSDDPVERLTSLFRVYLKYLFNFDKNLLRETIAATISEPESLGEEMYGMDLRLVGQVSSLLENFQKNGVIDETLPLEQASMILYGSFGTLALMYLMLEEISPDLLMETIGINIDLIFRSWRAE